MKKIFTFFIAIMALSMAANSQNVCTVDSTNVKFGITPNDTTAPHVVRGSAFDTVAQIYVPASITYMGFQANIIWLNIDSVNNFPTGIGFQRNPGVSDTIYGGGRQCILLSGTTMDTIGTYHLNFFGHVRVSVNLGITTIDTTVSLAQVGSQFGYFLTVDGGVGINDIGSNFNSALNVYPNPNNGQFQVSLSNIDKVNGEISVYDMTGRKVYNKLVDAIGFYTTSVDLGKFAKGLYTVQVRTENGVASKKISVE